MKSILLAGFIFFTLQANGQAADTLPIAVAIRTYLNGNQGSEKHPMQEFKKGFRLRATNDSFSIRGFSIGWHNIHGTWNEASYDTDSLNALQVAQLRLVPPDAGFYFDRILAIKEGKMYYLDPLHVQMTGIFKDYITIDNPEICHTPDNKLSCFSDGTYTLNFSNNRFTGFRTNDSLVIYNEEEKSLRIRKPANRSFQANTVMIQLVKNSIVISDQDGRRLLDSFAPGKLNLKGPAIFLSGSNGFDTLEVSTGGINVWVYITSFTRIKQWKIVTRGPAGYMYLNFHHGSNELSNIGMLDDRRQYGMLLTTYRGKQPVIRGLRAFYVRETNQDGERLITEKPLHPSYSFQYDRSGKLEPLASHGDVRHCSCSH